MVLTTKKFYFSLTLAAFACSSFAQLTTEEPVWSLARGYANGAAKFSNDGSRAFVYSQNSLAAFDTSNGKLVATTRMADEWVPNADGTRVYLTYDNNEIDYYDVETGVYTYVCNSPQPAYNLSVSPDGTKLAWWNAGKIKVYDLDASHLTVTYNLPNGNPTKISWLGNTKIVVAGPSIYNLTGTKLITHPLTDLPFSVSPDGNSIYQWYANQSLRKFNSTTGAQVWAKVVSDADQDYVFATSDNASVVLKTASFLSASNGMAVHSAANGKRTGLTPIINETPLAFSPTANQFVYNLPDGFGQVQLCGISTLATVTPQFNLTSNDTITSNLYRTKDPVLGTPLVTGWSGLGTDLVLRNSLTGGVNNTFSTDSATGVIAMSGDGTRLAKFENDGIGGGTLTVYNSSTMAVVASTTFANEVLESLQFGTSTRLLAKTDLRWRVLDVKGNGTIIKPSTLMLSQSDRMILSPNGLFVAGQKEGTKLLRVYAATTSTLKFTINYGAEGMIPADTKYFFTDANLLAFANTDPSLMTQLFHFRSYDVSGANPSLISDISYEDDVHEFVCADVSPDGTKLALVGFNTNLRINIYDLTTSTLLTRYQSPFTYPGQVNVLFSGDNSYLHVQAGDGSSSHVFTLQIAP